MTAARRLAITSLAALAVAGGGVAVGQATDDDPASPAAAPAATPVFAPPSPEECERLARSSLEASGEGLDRDEIVSCGERNYGEATLRVTP